VDSYRVRQAEEKARLASPAQHTGLFLSVHESSTAHHKAVVHCSRTAEMTSALLAIA
jgi:hypothetical protein